MENISEHLNKEGEARFKKIDRKSPEIMSALAEAPIFKKQGQVRARPAVEGEQIVTILASGAKETSNIAKVGDWVVTNPSEEQYLVSGKKFSDKYESSGTEGVYQAKGYCRAIKNPFGEPIEIMTSWKSPQTGDENCLIADACDANGENMNGEPYLIDGKAFTETYVAKE